MREQLALFGGGPPVPEGFRYEPNAVSPVDEAALLERMPTLPFKEFEFQGYLGKRRVVSYGFRYDYDTKTIGRVDDIPDFLLAVREVAANVAGIAPEQLQQALVTEYPAGAAIGWHRDRAVYGDIVGISLLSSCNFRLRRKLDTTWERYSLTAEPRSAYLLHGPSRSEWEHSIPAVDTLRYSITFRNLRSAR
ncbi:MAG: alpha-ketoglutarate-dependent dioxygenase AlkB [Gemmatimonadota bacterium]|nr:alpha-ketoglutarate-dependent dioxygenase AlkB [Gemmatimonadota bacterium]